MTTTEAILTSESLYEDYEDYEDQGDYIPMTLPLQIVSGILISVLIILAVGGNLLTIISYIRDQKLNSVYDFYIFNLAIADFTIGCISLPFYAVYTIKNFLWEFGKVFCKIWSVFDFTCCLQSVLLMVILSADRLMLITYGPFYQNKVTKKRSYIIVAISWLIAFLLYGPSIIGWDYWVGESTVEDMDCDVEFAYNVEFTTATAFVEFGIPFLMLVILNVLIYVKIRSKTKRDTRRRATMQQALTLTNVSVSGEEKTVNDVEATVVTDTKTPEKLHCMTNKLDKKDACKIHNKADTMGTDKQDSKIPNAVATVSKHAPDQTREVNTNTVSFSKGPNNKSQKKKRMSETSRDIKAARFLAILVIVFLICWAPYTFITIIIAFCKEQCVNTSAYEILNWLLWSKSAINPFLYAANSARYRYNFRKYLGCTRGSVHPTAGL